MELTIDSKDDHLTNSLNHWCLVIRCHLNNVNNQDAQQRDHLNGLMFVDC